MENLSSAPMIESTSNGHHHKLDNLPDLIYYHILKNLDLDDLWSLRLINKRFYSIAKNFKIVELSLLSFNPDNYRFSYKLDNWFSTIKPTRSEYQLDISKLPFLSKPSNNLLNLKYLKVQNSEDPFRLDDLNKFTKLQILETSWSYKRFKNHLLQLPDLKALSIDRYSDSTGSLVIDTPNLHSLSIRNGNGIKFNHPQSIRYYRTDKYDKNMTVLINLECLEIFFLTQSFKADDLMDFKNLRRLRLIDSVAFSFSQCKNLFTSKKDNLEFVLDGVKIKEVGQLCEFEWDKLKFQLNNYSDLEDDIHFIYHINYNYLVRLLPNQPSDLLNKYTNIQRIFIESRIEDLDRLVHFIRGCSNLIELNLKNSFLDQQFYGRLPVINSLCILKIINEEDLNLDYEFIMKMPYLGRFETNEDVLISEKLNLNYFKRLGCFSFKINNRVMKIMKESQDRYKVCDYKSLDLPDHGTISHDRLVEWTNWLRTNKQIETRSMSRKGKF